MKRLIWWIFSFVAFSLILNLLFTVFCFSNFGSSTGPTTEFIFYVANWPTVLLRIYPYVYSTDGASVYHMMGWLELHILIINSIVWGCLGTLAGLGVRKLTNYAIFRAVDP